VCKPIVTAETIPRGNVVNRAGRGIAIGLLLVGVAEGATVLKLSNEEITKRADVILHGKCTKKASRQDQDAKMVVTDYEFDVQELLKAPADVNSSDKTFKFSILGGKLEDGSGTFISGYPTYSVDEECIVFLDKVHPKTHCRTSIGLAQGKFTVKKEADSSKKYLVRELGDLNLVDEHGRTVGIASKEGLKLYLEVFVKEIKGYLASGEKK
jgi:hypothetical protein